MPADEWKYSSRNLKLAVILNLFTVLIIIISFSTPYWLVSVPDAQLPEPKFTNLGLWAVCLNGYHDMRHQYEVKFYGCKHILLEEYDIIDDELQPPFMVATQTFFTLCLIGMLIGLIFILMYLLCINEYYRVSVLKWLGVDLFVAAAFGTIALIIFGANGDDRDYMPDWEHNFLSWSFGLGCIGVILQWINGVLFIVEARVIERRERSNEKHFSTNEQTV